MNLPDIVQNPHGSGASRFEHYWDVRPPATLPGGTTTGFSERNTMKAVVAVLLISTLFLSGCASIVGDNSYAVTLTSSPEAARFVITNHNGRIIHTGTTPATVPLASSTGYFKSASYQVVFTKDGFQQSVVDLEGSVNQWYFGNLFLASVVGLLIVDPVTGAMWELPETRNVVLNAARPPLDTAQALATEPVGNL